MKIRLLLSFLITVFQVNAGQMAEVCAQSLNLGDYEQAKQLCLQQLELSSPQSVDSLYIYLELADISHALGEQILEAEYLKKVKEHNLFHNDITAQYRWNRKMGQSFYLKEDYFRSETYLISALNIALEENNEVWLSKSFNDVGLVTLKQGAYKQALINFEKSLELKRAQGDLYKIGVTLNNLGLTHTKLEEFENAGFYYKQAMEAFFKYTEQDDFDKRVAANISHLYEDMTRLYAQKGNMDEASFYAEEILKTFQLKFSDHEQARALLNVAKLYTSKQQFLQARDYLKQALELDSDYIEVLYEYAVVLFELGDEAQALKLAHQGLQFAEDSGHLLVSGFYRILSQLYEKNDIGQAYSYLNKYQKTREEFLNKKYDSELKTKQHQIEKEQIQYKLVTEQLTNSHNKAKIQSLTNGLLAAMSLAILTISFTLFYRYKKQKERESLLKAIAYHKQQLLMIGEEDESSQQQNADVEQLFKEQLVKTLVTALEIWEKNTGTNRVEFAEKSKLWTVSVDNGTLRTRSLDKYMRLDKLPQNPRWRQVANSCHFILSDPELPSEDRNILSDQLDQLLSLYEQMAMATT